MTRDRSGERLGTRSEPAPGEGATPGRDFVQTAEGVLRCAGCGRAIERPRQAQRCCSGRCRAAVSKRRALERARRDAWDEWLHDPGAVDRFPPEALPRLLRALERLCAAVRERLSDIKLRQGRSTG